MSDSPRKTLRLPVKPAGEETPVNPRRKPIRGHAANARRKPAVSPEGVTTGAQEVRQEKTPDRRNRPAGKRTQVDRSAERSERSERQPRPENRPAHEQQGGQVASPATGCKQYAGAADPTWQ